MTNTLFCYCCRVHHPKEQMRRYATRTGARWRCLRSIDAAAREASERDAFGRRQSEQNQMAATRTAQRAAALHLESRRP
jgi:hypothetical protein